MQKLLTVPPVWLLVLPIGFPSLLNYRAFSCPHLGHIFSFENPSHVFGVFLSHLTLYCLTGFWPEILFGVTRLIYVSILCRSTLIVPTHVVLFVVETSWTILFNNDDDITKIKVYLWLFLFLYIYINIGDPIQ